MSENFLEILVSELESSCIHKESNYHILWKRADVNIDISKCRNYCHTDNGYMWNGTQMCESCNKILHSKLDRFNKSSAEIAFEVISIEEKINKLTNIISKLENQVTNLNTRITEIADKNDEQIIYFEHQNKNIKDNIIKFDTQINFNNNLLTTNIDIIDIKYQNLINSDRENIYELQKKFDNCVNNIENIESIINNQQNIINNEQNIINNQKSFHSDNLNNKDNIVDKNDNNKDNIVDNNIDNNIYNNIDNNKNMNMNINKNATIKIIDKYKIGGIGYILDVNTITPGKIKRNYVYQSKNKEVVFRIKDFENNFNPQEFEYPASKIFIKPEFIKGNMMSIELYDEFISITS